VAGIYLAGAFKNISEKIKEDSLIKEKATLRVVRKWGRESCPVGKMFNLCQYKRAKREKAIRAQGKSPAIKQNIALRRLLFWYEGLVLRRSFDISESLIN